MLKNRLKQWSQARQQSCLDLYSKTYGNTARKDPDVSFKISSGFMFADVEISISNIPSVVKVRIV